MKSYRDGTKAAARMWNGLWLGLLVAAAALAAREAAAATPNVALWDTGAPLADAAAIEARSGWKPVPRDLLTLEADPSKASSDPGYYGREYVFKGDAVVENQSLTVAFCSTRGRVVLHAKPTLALTAHGAPENTSPGRRILEFAPLRPDRTEATTISRVEIVRNADDQVALEISFSAGNATVSSGVFSFDKTGIVEVRPAENMTQVRLHSAIEFGVVPDFVGDDLVFSPTDYPSATTLCLPSENLFLGLLQGEESELVLTWPGSQPQLTLQLGESQQGRRLVESIDFAPDGQNLYLAALHAPGIWHREPLTPAFLEKDVTTGWKRPFPAKWKTLLYEEATRTTFAFKESRGEIWRGVPGSYSYPVWWNGDEAMYRLGKKVPPKGESVIYFVEGQDTPPSVPTPVDVLKAALGRPAADAILDVAGRKLRTHHRRGGDGVRRACTCGCTEAIQAVFEAGEEVTQRPYIEGALEDMVYFVRRHLERIDNYQRFANDLSRFLQARAGASPELKPYLDALDQIARLIPQEYAVQKENMKSLAHADELVRQTLALTAQKDPNNLKAYLELLKAWRDMGGAQDYVLAQCHTITRRLSQEAGYLGADQPAAAALARDIRARCRQALRNPDGYEIWADY